MKKLNIKNIKNSQGFVSIETLIVAGIVIASGAFFISKLAWKGKDISAKSNNSLNMSKNILDDNYKNTGNTTNTPEANNEKPKDEGACSLENPKDLEDYEYKEVTINGINGIEITKHTCAYKEVNIPSCINGKKVISIGEKAFTLNLADGEFPPLNYTQLTKVHIPDGIIRIGEKAFYNNNLTNIDIPDSVTEIGDSAFEGNSLTNVKLSKNLTKINDRAFYGNKITKIDIPNSVTEIGDSAFDNNQLTEVNLSKSLIKIGKYAFNNSKITKIDIPDSVIEIGDNAFADNQLTEVKLPKSLIKLGEYAFNRNKLTKVNIPDGVTEIKDCTFNSNELTNIRIPNGVKRIGRSAFEYNKITEVTIPKSVERIDNQAFQQNYIRTVNMDKKLYDRFIEEVFGKYNNAEAYKDCTKFEDINFVFYK